PESRVGAARTARTRVAGVVRRPARGPVRRDRGRHPDTSPTTRGRTRWHRARRGHGRRDLGTSRRTGTAGHRPARDTAQQARRRTHRMRLRRRRPRHRRSRYRRGDRDRLRLRRRTSTRHHHRGGWGVRTPTRGPRCSRVGPDPLGGPSAAGGEERTRPEPSTVSRTPRFVAGRAKGKIVTELSGQSSFDSHKPPARDLLDNCVHCGFCLPTCPTYQLWGEEMDSPCGRIYLMDLAERGEIGLEGAFFQHIDACLGCMACVTACPSGVQYYRLLEATRPLLERNVRRSTSDRFFRNAVFALFPYRRRLRLAAVLGLLYQKSGLPKPLERILPPRLRAAQALLPPVRLREAFATLPRRIRPSGPVRRRVALLSGCVQDVFFHEVNAATQRVLAAEGCEVLTPRRQGCCGALGLHAGR